MLHKSHQFPLSYHRQSKNALFLDFFFNAKAVPSAIGIMPPTIELAKNFGLFDETLILFPS